MRDNFSKAIVLSLESFISFLTLQFEKYIVISSPRAFLIKLLKLKWVCKFKVQFWDKGGLSRMHLAVIVYYCVRVGPLTPLLACINSVLRVPCECREVYSKNSLLKKVRRGALRFSQVVNRAGTSVPPAAGTMVFKIASLVLLTGKYSFITYAFIYCFCG